MRRPTLRAIAGISLLASGLMLASCTRDTAPTGPAAESLLGGLLPVGLLSCDAQPAATTTQLVGPSGGTLQVGGHTLVIPPGALTTQALISAEAPGESLSTVRFWPEGLTFKKPATLTLDYSHCPAARLLLLKRVAYTSDALDILSFLLSQDDLLRMRISADLDHFSRYAVSW